MDRISRTLAAAGLAAALCFVGCGRNLKQPSILFGAFIADEPRPEDFVEFENDYGRPLDIVMVFLDWDRFLSPELIQTVAQSGAVFLITWEPWHADIQKGIDYEALLRGKDDAYITAVAQQLQHVQGEVWLRFAHEMNGDWYPWSGKELSPQKYISVYRYIKELFDRVGASRVKWVFSINWEDAAGGPTFREFYPGNDCVDMIGLDGYNWGDTKPWSRWMSFESIFDPVYERVTMVYDKPVIISEFGSSGHGGDKAVWIREAFHAMAKMPALKAAVLFNVNKETDWRFDPQRPEGRVLHKINRERPWVF